MAVVDGKERTLKETGTCQHAYCYAVVAISIQPLSLTLYTEAQTPSSPSQKKGVYSPSEVTVH